MNFTFDTDRQKIRNKYHIEGEPFDPYHRMRYHGWEGDPATGIPIPEILEKIKESVKTDTLAGKSHELCKADAIRTVLENTMIALPEWDYFPLIYTWNREISSETVERWKKESFSKLPAEYVDKMDLFRKSMLANGWPDYDHVVPDWQALLSLGFVGIRQRARDYREKLSEKSPLTDDQKAFFDGIDAEYAAIIDFIGRLYRYSLTRSHEKAALTAEALRNLSTGAPRSFFDALMLIYLYFMISESVDCYQVRSLGNGLDHSLSPFYFADLESGKFTREETKELLRYFFFQWQAIGNYWGQPFYLGGSNLDGSTRINQLSYDIIDVYSGMEIYNPKIQIKYNTNVPKDFLNKILSDLRRSVGSYVFCCEPNQIRSIMEYGVPYEEAYDYDIRGCYETGVRGNEASPCNFYVNALKCVEYVFSEGYDRRIGRQVGVRTQNVGEMTCFEDFRRAFFSQLDYVLEETYRITCAYEKDLSFVAPSSLYSATILSSLERGRDAYQDGAKYCNSTQLFCGFASAVDAVMAVYELVFEKKRSTLPELKRALDADWEGFELLRMNAQNCRHKYGRGDETADAFAVELSEYFLKKVKNRPNSRGGVFKTTNHPAMQFVWEGEKTLATPDGRKAGDEMSKNATAAVGSDTEGVTALILSSLKLHPTEYTESFCLDVMLHASAVEGDDGLSAMKNLLDTYLLGGGISLQFNVFREETLRDAQIHPEKYRNLQVRVCGWNVLWTNLSFKEQEAYIRRLCAQS